MREYQRIGGWEGGGYIYVESEREVERKKEERRGEREWMRETERCRRLPAGGDGLPVDAPWREKNKVRKGGREIGRASCRERVCQYV